MSNLSGKCDLADHLYMEVTHKSKNSDNVLVSDIMECFKEFKKRTDGKIYQHVRLKVTQFNQFNIEKMNPMFKVIEHKEYVDDKRKKDGKREVVSYTYNYYGNEYTLKEINKKGVYIEKAIQFNTLIDLLPYLPYIVSAMSCCEGHEHVIISNRSYVDDEEDDLLQGGYQSSMPNVYRENLSKLYQEVILRYYNPNGREHLEMIEFDENHIGHTSKPIDESFKPEWKWEDGVLKMHWTSPKVIDASKGIIEMHKEDYDDYIGHKCLVYYIEKQEDKLYLE